MGVDLKELSQLIKVCRKLGVKSYKGHNIEFTLDNKDSAPRRRRKKEFREEPIPSNAPTEEQLLYWSAGHAPAAHESE